VLSTLDCDETRANCEVAIGESLPVWNCRKRDVSGA
jgi:hypothetical protein